MLGGKATNANLSLWFSLNGRGINPRFPSLEASMLPITTPMQFVLQDFEMKNNN
jgi:hypothetical protein